METKNNISRLAQAQATIDATDFEAPRVNHVEFKAFFELCETPFQATEFEDMFLSSNDDDLSDDALVVALGGLRTTSYCLELLAAYKEA